MNVIQFLNFKDFDTVPLEPVVSSKAVVSFFLNIITFGIYGAAEALNKQHQIKKLTIDQESLLKQAEDLVEEWTALEQHLSHLMSRLQELGADNKGNFAELKGEIEATIGKENNLQLRKIELENSEKHFSLSEFALGVITLIGHLFANVATLGLYGVYQFYILNHRAATLKAQNNSICIIVNQRLETKDQTLQKQIDLIRNSLKLFETNEGFRNTVPAEAYLQVEQVNKQRDDLHIKHAEVVRNYEAIRTQKVVADQDKQKVENELYNIRRNLNFKRQEQSAGKDQNLKIKNETMRFKQDYEYNVKELDRLRRKIGEANNKVLRIVDLEKEIQRLKEVQKRRPDAHKLQAEVGPIAPKYTPRKEDGPLDGAMDFKEEANAVGLPEGRRVDAAWIEYAKAYQNRYIQIPGPFGQVQKLRTASQIAKAGFDYAFQELTKLEYRDKIKINQSEQTPATPAAQAIYRFMALDLVKGGKVFQDGCHGFILQISEEVAMYPSQPEKVLQYKEDAKGDRNPEVVLNYKRKDDFTPSPQELGLRDGIDPVSAKWIYAQLNNEEREHLFNLLMAPAIPNDNADYQRTLDFMRNKQNQRVKLIETAYNLLADMGISMGKKFGQNIFIDCWQNHCNDGDLEPFIKDEDLQPDLTHVVDMDMVHAPQEGREMEWELDPDVLNAGGADFANLIAEAQIRYQTVFANFSSDLLQVPHDKDLEYDKITWAQVYEQYHVSHQMLGNQYCLFSNLLAIFLTDKDKLTEANVMKLRRAMAAYLDKLQTAKTAWQVRNARVNFYGGKQELNERADKIKELAELATSFEDSIKRLHHCDLTQYQLWLRGEPSKYIDGRGHVYSANISIHNLTPLEIQLGAFTIGVKIGMLPIELNAKVKVDEYGRLVPEGEFYGPNTKEMLLMGSIDGTYYGLYPKLNFEKFQAEQFDMMFQIESYWNSIDEKANRHAW